MLAVEDHHVLVRRAWLLTVVVIDIHTSTLYWHCLRLYLDGKYQRGLCLHVMMLFETVGSWSEPMVENNCCHPCTESLSVLTMHSVILPRVM